jgi:hypothetical protein
VCAALRHANGDLILGPRHFDSTMHKQIEQYKLMNVSWKTAEQGFIDTWGDFLTREDALQRAVETGQLTEKKTHPPHKLYSEDLY